MNEWSGANTMTASDLKPQPTAFIHWTWTEAETTAPIFESPTHPLNTRKIGFLQMIRQWIDQIEVKNSQLAHLLCQWIPTQCPFERDIQLFGKTLLHIPPLCKLNPLYNEVVALRFRALCYLADECGEDVSRYC